MDTMKYELWKEFDGQATPAAMKSGRTGRLMPEPASAFLRHTQWRVVQTFPRPARAHQQGCVQ
jgi:hypothetical protein